MKTFVIALRNVRRNTRRTIFSAAAIAISTMVIVFMFALIEGMKVDMYTLIFQMVSGQVRVRTVEFDAAEMRYPLSAGLTNAPALVDALESRPEVKCVAPRITFPTALYRNGKTFKGLGIGMDFPREEVFQGLTKRLVAGVLPRMGARETALSAGLAQSMGVGVGDKITLYTKTAVNGMNGMTLLVTGIVAFNSGTFNTSAFFAPLDTMQRLLQMPGSVVEVLIALSSGNDPKDKAADLSMGLAAAGWSGLSVKPWQETGIMYTYISLADAIYMIFAACFLLIGSTVIVNTTMMVIYERTREIGTMGALGMTSGQIVGLFFVESLIIAAIGAAAGTLLGIGITIPLSIYGIDYTQAMKSVTFAIPSIYYPILNLKSTVVSFLYATAISSLVSLIPSRRASRVEPVVAMRAI